MIIDLSLVLAVMSTAVFTIIVVGWAQPAAERWSYRRDKDL
jgi:hypothetical protein